jgi:hypothetical protein
MKTNYINKFAYDRNTKTVDQLSGLKPQTKYFIGSKTCNFKKKYFWSQKIIAVGLKSLALGWPALVP